jgi:ATP-dependent DNA ligase
LQNGKDRIFEATRVFYAFDLVYLNGPDLRELPLIHRKRRLKKLIERSGCPAIIYAQHVENGAGLFEEICERDLEGVVAKRRDDSYSSTTRWLKIMNPMYTQHEGRHDMFTAFHERQQKQSQLEG